MAMNFIVVKHEIYECIIIIIDDLNIIENIEELPNTIDYIWRNPWLKINLYTRDAYVEIESKPRPISSSF